MSIYYYSILIFIQELKVASITCLFNHFLSYETRAYVAGVSFTTAELRLLVWLLDKLEDSRIEAEEELNALYFRLEGVD